VYYLSEEYDPVYVEVPAIIDRETWEEAQRILDEGKAQSRRNSKYKFLMARRAKCSLCEYTMRTRQRDSHNPNKPPYRQYVCGANPSFDKTRTCTLPSFNADMVDDVVWGWLMDKANDPDGIRKILKESQGELAQINEKIYARIAEIEAQRQRQANKVDTLCAMYSPQDVQRSAEVRNLFDRLKSETEQVLTELRSEEDELRSQLQDSTISDHYIDQWDRYMGRVRGKMENWPFEKRRQHIEDLNIRVFMKAENGKRVLYIAVYTYVDRVELDDFPTDFQTPPCL
jgi:hypothetical protein